MNLGKSVKITTALAYASGTADRNGEILDMSGYDGVLMICQTATIAGSAVDTFKAQQDTASGGGTMADLTGTGISIADDDDDQLFIIDLYKPRERYVRCVMDKDASNACAETVIYVQYSGSKAPIDNSVTDASTYELHVSPAEGTA